MEVGSGEKYLNFLAIFRVSFLVAFALVVVVATVCYLAWSFVLVLSSVSLWLWFSS